MKINQTDLLNDLNEKRQDNKVLNLVTAIYVLLAIAFLVYYLWPFGMKVLLRAKKDSELQLLAIIHVIYPVIALTVLAIKQRFGWVLMLFGSLVNVAYAVGTYGVELMTGDALQILRTDRMILFFLVYGLLTILLFRRSLLLRLNIERRFLFWTVGISASVVCLFLISVLRS